MQDVTWMILLFSVIWDYVYLIVGISWTII